VSATPAARNRSAAARSSAAVLAGSTAMSGAALRKKATNQTALNVRSAIDIVFQVDRRH